MENATKALLIAGGVLLAMMIIGTGIILYNSFSNTSDQYSQRMSATELAKFNAEFEVFRGRTDVTAQEIVSLINMVEEYKKKTPMNVDVKINNDTYTNTIQFLKENIEKRFTCEAIEYNSSGEVKEIKLIINIT